MKLPSVNGQRKQKLLVLEQLYLSCKDELYACAYTVLKNDADADDAVYKAIRRFWRHPEYIKDHTNCEKCKQLLLLAVRHQAIDIYRKNKRLGKISYEETEKYIPCAEDASAKTEMSVLLAQALSRLSEEEREVLLLRFSHEYEYAEIAKLLAITESTARKRVSRAKEKFRSICMEMELIDW